MESILLSIIMPSLNQGAYIENAILSVLNQDYPRWEPFIQDGGSIDQTASICSSYASRDSRIHFASEPDKGFADAVNKGLAKCNGTLIGIQSSDDFYASKTVFSEVVKKHEQYPSLILIAGYSVLVDSRLRQVMTPPDRQENGFIRSETIYNLDNHFSQASTFFSRERAYQVNGLDGSVDMVADTDFWIRMANCYPVYPNRVFRTSQIWACATLHEGQRTGEYHKFVLGRAKMAIKHLNDSNIDLASQFKFEHALNSVYAAYEHYAAIGFDPAEVEELHRELTGKRVPLARNILAKFRIIMTSYTAYKISNSSTNKLGIYHKGYSYRWFLPDAGTSCR